MKPQDIFGLIIRTLGLSVTLYGIWTMIAGFVYLPRSIISLYSPSVGVSSTGTFATTGSFYYFAYAVPMILVGIFILAFADPLVSFTYRKPSF